MEPLEQLEQLPEPLNRRRPLNVEPPLVGERLEHSACPEHSEAKSKESG